MNKVRRLEKLVEDHLPAVDLGQETIGSVLSKYPRDASELQPRLEAACWLSSVSKNLAPRSGFISSSRKYLEDKLASTPSPSLWQRLLNRYTPQRWIFNLTAPILLLMVLALVINNLILTARLSIPGDPLYPTKLAIEDLQLAFTFDPTHRTDLMIQFSRERTTEFVQLVLEGDYEQLPTAATRMETDIIASLRALDEISIQDQATGWLLVDNFHGMLTNEIALLKVLKETSPVSSRPGIDMAIQAAQVGVLALP